MHWLPLDHEDAARMVSLLDADRDGLVSLYEFRRFAFLLPESQASHPPGLTRNSSSEKVLVQADDKT